jgi:2'-5' RNA ligase
MRAFVAVDVPPLPGLLEYHTGAHAGHLTLRFLGETAPDRVAGLAEALREATAGTAAFDLVFVSAGAFPSLQRPRVAWVGVRDGADRLAEMASRLDRALERQGLPPEPRGFQPHLTLFRVRRREDADRARALVERLRDRELGSCRVDAVRLKESVLRPEGTLHRDIVTVPLADAAGSPAEGR